jgi:hypothetical protein
LLPDGTEVPQQLESKIAGLRNKAMGDLTTLGVEPGTLAPPTTTSTQPSAPGAAPVPRSTTTTLPRTPRNPAAGMSTEELLQRRQQLMQGR